MGKYSTNAVQQDLINYDGSTLLPNVLITSIYDSSDNNGFAAIKEIFKSNDENNPISINYLASEYRVKFNLNYDTTQFSINNGQLHIKYDKGGNNIPVYFNNGEVKECESVTAKYMSSAAKQTQYSIPYVNASESYNTLYFNTFAYLAPNASTESKVLTSTNGTLSWQVSSSGGSKIGKADASKKYYLLGVSQDDVESISSATSISTIYTGYNSNDEKSAYFKNGTIYQTSDESLKTFVGDIDINLDNLKTIKKGEFYWNDDPEKNIDLGVTAQSLEALYPQLVSDSDGVKAVAYNKLGVISLAAIDKLYERIQALEKEVKSLKKELKK